MNKIQTIPGTGDFASVTGTPQHDETPAVETQLSAGIAVDGHAISGDDGRATPLLTRLHAAGPQYRRSMFRR